MISSSIRIGVLFSLLIFVLHAKAQYTQNERSLDYVYQKGMNALHQGDTLTAFQYIESAYHFEAKQENSKENNIEDINYYYTYLSLVLD